jgi:type IV pilus assembly protein PilY1
MFDENLDANLSDVRASIHGDVLHSRPGVVNYNRTGDDNDIVVFYGGNDGLLHAVTGGQGGGGGTELWSFVAPEFFPKLKRLYDNGPKISTTDPRPYFFDGMIGTWYQDVDKDGVLSVGDGDKAYLYVSARRGGRLLYALDVRPHRSQAVWRRGCPIRQEAPDAVRATGLGQTWSLPQPVQLRHTANGAVMGAGYASAAEDAMPQGTATMGRGIMAIDGLTGNVIWQAGPLPPGRASAAPWRHALASPRVDRAGPQCRRLRRSDLCARHGGSIWRADTRRQPGELDRYASLPGWHRCGCAQVPVPPTWFRER